MQCGKILSSQHLDPLEPELDPFRVESYKAILIACATQLATSGQFLSDQELVQALEKPPGHTLQVPDSGGDGAAGAPTVVVMVVTVLLVHRQWW